MADYSEVGGENVNVLKALINGEEYEGPITSRNSAIIKSIIDNTEYTDEAKSEIEALLLQLKESSGGGETPNFILQNVPIQNDQGAGLSYTFDEPLIVGKQYLIMWGSTRTSQISAPLGIGFTKTSGTDEVYLDPRHGWYATLNVTLNSLSLKNSTDWDTRYFKISLIELPDSYSEGLYD